jgi:hypothetical protein
MKPATHKRDEQTQKFWDDAFLLEYANCTSGRKARDPQGCVRLAREAADLALEQREQSLDGAK